MAEHNIVIVRAQAFAAGSASLPPPVLIFPVLAAGIVASPAVALPSILPSLGKNRDTPPSSFKTGQFRAYHRQAMAQRLVAGYWSANDENLRGSSVLGCGRWRAFGAQPDVAQILVEDGKPRMSGHFICGCNWTCETCARATVARNRSWLRAALFPALTANGKSGSLVTLTLAHSYSVDWAVPVAALKAAFKLFDKRMSKVYKKAGSVGKFKAFEVTIGRNGIHPHFHLLVTHNVGADLVALEAAMREAWYSAVVDAGGSCTERGFDFKADCVNDYVAKIDAAHELSAQSTKLGRKNGKTLSQLLDAAGRGDLVAGAEWQRAIKALGSTNRFQAGNMPKKLGILTPSEWEDKPDVEIELDADAPAPVLIEYRLNDHLSATNPSTGRPGLAMILRAAQRGGKEKVLLMVDALCRDSERKSVASLRPPPRTGIEPEIFILARARPLSREEVALYLETRRNLALCAERELA